MSVMIRDTDREQTLMTPYRNQAHNNRTNND